MKNKNLSFMKCGLFFIFLLFQPLAKARPSADRLIYPYQNCNPPAEDFTDSLLADFSKTEADFCFICDTNDRGRERQIDQIKSLDSLAAIPKECFLAITARGNRLFADKQYRRCNDRNSTGSARGKLCANKKYVEIIHKAFAKMSRCFNFDLDRQTKNLAIINQESGGILNVTSPSGARCMAQLTKSYVSDIIKNIKNNGKKERQIYNEVRQRCPWASELILDRKKVKAKNGWFTCQTTRDPHICLFYKFIGLETNLRKIKENLELARDYSQPKYMGNREFTEEEKTKYKLPLQTNEILNITVEFNDPNRKAKTYTFEHASAELLNVIRKIEPQAKSIKTSKIPLFKNDKDIQNIFYYWSHNGGSAYAGNRMITIVERLKQDLARSCSSSDTSDRCALRRQIQRGEGLSAKEALPFFEKSIGDNYQNQNRRKEVTGYIRNLIANNKGALGYEEGSYETNQMIGYYKKSVKFKDIKLSDEDAIAFQKRVAEICPKINLVSP